MRRRDFIGVLSGAAVAWPSGVQAKQPERARRIGLLAPYNDERDSRVQANLPVFRQRLRELGWTEDRNIRIDYRFTGQDAELIRIGAQELIALTPDVIVVWANPAAASVRKATHTIPVVFTNVSDPVGGGFVANLARPGENITGFQNFEPAIGGKWLDLLSEIAPAVRRVAFVYSPEIPAHAAFMRAAEAASGSLRMMLTGVGVRNAADIETALAAFAREPYGGFIVAPSPLIATSQETIIALAARLLLPAIYPFRYFCSKGGLVSYGFDPVEQQRGAASYVDRILKGEKPGDLPVQAPTKYELAINLKAAKALGVVVSLQLQQRADELIE
jgi:putative ABC transport system substrate-binding protein